MLQKCKRYRNLFRQGFITENYDKMETSALCRLIKAESLFRTLASFHSVLDSGHLLKQCQLYANTQVSIILVNSNT